MAIPDNYEICVDWNGDGDFTDANDNITADIKALNWQRGKEKQLDSTQAAILNLVIKPGSATKYSPENAGSVLVGTLLPYKVVRVRVDIGGTWYTQFYGYIKKYIPHPHWGKNDAYIYCVDGMEQLARVKTNMENLSPVPPVGIGSGNIFVAAIAEADLTYPSHSRNIVRKSDGTLWVTYLKGDAATFQDVYCAYSIDDGINWIEERITDKGADAQYDPCLAIDSADNVHLVWRGLGWGINIANRNIQYCKRIKSWQAQESVTDLANNQYRLAMAIDSADNIHVVWSGEGWGSNPADQNIQYRKRNISSWQAQEAVTDIATDQRFPTIAIDENNNIHVSWEGLNGHYEIYYRKRTTSWGSIEQVTSGTQSQNSGCIAIDSESNVHLCWHGRGYGTFPLSPQIVYAKRTTSWGSVELVTDVNANQLAPNASIAIDRANDIHIVWTGRGWGVNTLNYNIQYRKRTSGGAWETQVGITDVAFDQFTPSLIWAYHPLVSGIRTNIYEAGYMFVYTSQTASGYNVTWYRDASLAWRQEIDWEAMTEYNIINALLDVANQPLSMRTIDSSNPQLYAFWSEEQPVLQGIKNLENMTGGMFYFDYQGYAVWESRNYRSINKATTSATFNNTMFDMPYELSEKDIFNHIVVKWTPAEPAGTEGGGGTADVTCKHIYEAPPWQRLGYEVENVHAFYTAHGEEAASWSNIQARIFKALVDVTNLMTLYIKKQTRTSCHLAYGNYYYDVGYSYIPYILWLSVDYTPLQAPEDAGGELDTPSEVEVEDATSIAAYGLRTKNIYLPYPMDEADALALANFYLQYYKDPVGLAQMVLKNEDATNLLQQFSRRMSDRITCVCDRLGMTATDFFINKVDNRISSDGYEITSTFHLEKAATQRQLWVLNISALGTNTRLGPG